MVLLDLYEQEGLWEGGSLKLSLHDGLEPTRTVAHQAPLSMGFPRQDYWSGLSFPSPGDLSNTGIKATSPTLGGGFSTSEPPGKDTSFTIL